MTLHEEKCMDRLRRKTRRKNGILKRMKYSEYCKINKTSPFWERKMEFDFQEQSKNGFDSDYYTVDGIPNKIL